MDKVLHFIAGAVVFLIANCFMSLPIIAVIIVGVGKEVYDKFHNGTVEVLDALATIAGGVLMWLIIGG